MKSPYLTIDEMADMLKVGKCWLYSKTRQTGANTIPVLRVGKHMRFDPENVIAWLQEQSKRKETDRK